LTVTSRETVSGPGARPPHDAPGEVAALRAFESANDRAATPAERKLLRDLAARYEPVAVAATARAERRDLPESGWGWLEAAVWEAVAAGSAFVAPRRLREILARWERDGFPGPDDPEPPFPGPERGDPRPRPRTAAPPREETPLFAIAEVGLSNRQVWATVLAELARGGRVSRGDLETWLRPTAIVGRDRETLLVGAPNGVARDRIASRLLPALREALAATLGVAVPIAVVVTGEATPDAPDRDEPGRGREVG
jgi:hypothetical protein